MISSRPYLLRALYDWIVDCELTPYVVIDTSRDDVAIPEEFTEGDRIVLNISPRASRGLIIDNDRVILTTRFAGVPTQLTFPPDAVLAIYAKENGRGMVFSDVGGDGNTGTEDDSFGPSETMWEGETAPEATDQEQTNLEVQKPASSTELVDTKDPQKRKKTSKKPFLTVVK